jgi:hypothetical protein
MAQSFKIFAKSTTANTQSDLSLEDYIKFIPGYIEGRPVAPHQLSQAANIFANELNQSKNLNATDWTGDFTVN